MMLDVQDLRARCWVPKKIHEKTVKIIVKVKLYT